MNIKKLKTVVNKLIAENRPAITGIKYGYRSGYADGFNDALIELMQKLNIGDDEKVD